MNTSVSQYIAFAGHTCVASGSLGDVGQTVRTYLDENGSASVAIFNAGTSAPMDLDLRGTPEEVREKAVSMAVRLSKEATGPSKAGPGRPRLGVVGREVTLLPRHWDWLNAQPGGASVTLRKLVEASRKRDQGAQHIRQAQDIAYGFISAIAGDLPGFEEATRALYAWDLERLEELMSGWPQDIRDHAIRLVRSDSGVRESQEP